jgi:hypothetical protein
MARRERKSHESFAFLGNGRFLGDTIMITLPWGGRRQQQQQRLCKVTTGLEDMGFGMGRIYLFVSI